MLHSLRRSEVPCSSAEDRSGFTSLFEQAIQAPHYDTKKNVWDEVLRVLNLSVRYQPAIVKVLQEGRWREKANPRAYVATAAARAALGMKLLNFREKEF